jgi:hypothetical protein
LAQEADVDGDGDADLRVRLPLRLRFNHADINQDGANRAQQHRRFAPPSISA